MEDGDFDPSSKLSGNDVRLAANALAECHIRREKFRESLPPEHPVLQAEEALYEKREQALKSALVSSGSQNRAELLRDVVSSYETHAEGVHVLGSALILECLGEGG